MLRALRHLSWLAAAALACVPASSGAQTAQTTAAATSPAISAADLRVRLYLIADDSLKGRLAGSAGDSVATAYIAAEFARVGLEPAGENGWFQTVHFKERGREPATPARNVIGVLRGSDPMLQERVRGDERAQRSRWCRAAGRGSRRAPRHELRGGDAQARRDGRGGAGVGDARARLDSRAAGAAPGLDLQRRGRRRVGHRRAARDRGGDVSESD